ncbi:MAG TPA: nucleotidyltransferase domain-containing protein [Nitrospiraceae bacterium]|nr:nucleotidyltransferase domain-containing protein [Nitrospiraceae bacterium]
MAHTILKVLVGSHAHGLAGPDSDKDYRSVFVMPTVELFRLGFKYQGTRMMKEEADETSWEVGHFLQLAVQCHPLVLETFMAPVEVVDAWGERLRALFPAVWSAQTAYEAFLQYGDNQRRKMLDKKDGRPGKYAVAYVRILFHLCELLERGTFTLNIVDSPIGESLRRIKDGRYRTGEVIDLGEYWTQEATHRLAACSHQADRKAVDDFLIALRRAFLY